MPVMHLSPSLTPRNPTPHTPAARLYELTSEAEVLDALDLSLDIDQSNARGESVWLHHRLKRQYNLSSLDTLAWAAWLDGLSDAGFAAHFPPQRCADEIEADYAKCKASVICAMREVEPTPYAACLRRVRSHAHAPHGWSEASKRRP